MKNDPRPSDRAFAIVRKMARYAVRHDSWMQPIPEDFVDVKDYGEFTQYHEAAWEETCHFAHFYGQPIYDLADRQALRQQIDKSCGERNWSIFYYAFYCPLKEAFWEEWEDRIKLFEAWEESKKEKHEHKPVHQK